jgi:hypothetical protein
MPPAPHATSCSVVSVARLAPRPVVPPHHLQTTRRCTCSAIARWSCSRLCVEQPMLPSHCRLAGSGTPPLQAAAVQDITCLRDRTMCLKSAVVSSLWLPGEPHVAPAWIEARSRCLPHGEALPSHPTISRIVVLFYLFPRPRSVSLDNSTPPLSTSHTLLHYSYSLQP